MRANKIIQTKTPCTMSELTIDEVKMVDGGLSGPATGAVGAAAVFVGGVALAVTFPFSGAIGLGLVLGGAINLGVGALSSFGGGLTRLNYTK